MSGIDEVLEAAEVHGLLAEAAAGAGEPQASVEWAFAEAGRVRQRRRAAVGAAVGVAAVALLALLLPGPGKGVPASPSGIPTARAVVPMPSPSSSPKASPGVTLKELLPADVGELTLLSPLDRDTPDGASLDGTYLVRKNGAIGLINVTTGLAIPANPGCGVGAQNENDLSCTAEDLGGGHSLRLTEVKPWAHNGADGRTLGRSYQAILGFNTGKVLFVTAAAGFTGPGADGPSMAQPPLTMAQFRTFALRPELLVGADLSPQTPPPGMSAH